MRDTPGTDDLEDGTALAEALRPALHRLYRQLRREIDDPDISRLQALVLVGIIRQPGIGVAELARQEKLRGPTISAHVKALELDGLVARAEPDPNDRRRSGLIATAKGEALVNAMKQRRTDWLASQLARLPPEAREAIRAAIGPLGQIGD